MDLTHFHSNLGNLQGLEAKLIYYKPWRPNHCTVFRSFEHSFIVMGCSEPWGKDIPRLSMTEREFKFLGLPRWDLDALFLGDFAYSGGG